MQRPLVLISTSYPDGNDGEAAAGTFVRDFAEALAQHAPVHVVAPARAAGDEQLRGVQVRRFAAPRLPLSSLVSPDPRRWAELVATWRAGAAAVKSLAAETNPRHLFALWALPSGAWARAAGGIPYSIWALGSDIWTLGRIPLVRTALRSVLRGAALRFADGEQLRTDVERIGGLPCEFLASSRRLPRVARSASAGGLRLTFLGRWHPNKGVDLALAALEGLEERDWAKIARVDFYGGGPLEAQVRAGVARLAQAGRPVFAGGYLDAQGAAQALAATDWLLLASRIESIPVIFSDAMQAGCRVLAMPVGDLPALLARHPVGALAEDVSASAYRSALQSVLHSPPAPEAAAAMRAAASAFDVGENARRLLERIA